MYLYEKNPNYTAEDMVKDYLEFRQERENRINVARKIKISSLENMQSDSFESFYSKPYFLKNDSVNSQEDNYGINVSERQELTDKIASDSAADKIYFGETGISEKDVIYMKHVSSDIAKKIQPIVENIADEMDYEESPIYDEYIPREVIDTVTDRAYETAITKLPELKDQMSGMMEDEYNNGNLDDYVWSKAAITKELIRQLLFIEIFGKRRCNKRIVKDSYRYY